MQLWESYLCSRVLWAFPPRAPQRNRLDLVRKSCMFHVVESGKNFISYPAHTLEGWRVPWKLYLSYCRTDMEGRRTCRKFHCLWQSRGCQRREWQYSSGNVAYNMCVWNQFCASNLSNLYCTYCQWYSRRVKYSILGVTILLEIGRSVGNARRPCIHRILGATWQAIGLNLLEHRKSRMFVE